MRSARISALAGLGLVVMQIAACGGGDSDEGTAASNTAPRPPAPTATLPAASATTSPAEARAPPPRPAFEFKAQKLPGAVRERITGSSWHEGCPVPLSGLRYVAMNHWGFDGNVREGVMIVNASAVDAVEAAFGALFAKRFPIRRMHLVDDYGADDYASIEADNTSSFNCRQATNSSRWSEHAYGRAIDINPIENPYVYANGTSTHIQSRPYLDRSSRFRGGAFEGGTLVEAFDAVGWDWGGRWSPARDLQHFSASGR